jgi:uncharacterized protein (DUF39 family)
MLEGWIRTLELLTPIAKSIPLLGSPLEGSLEAVVQILKFAQVRRVLQETETCAYSSLQSVKTNKEQTKDLAEHAARWTKAVVNSLDDAKTDVAELEHMRADITPILEYVLPI